jgi:hypothetical protein
MEAGFIRNPNTGEHCHSLADAYMASLAESSLPEDIEAREEYDRLVAWSLEKRNVSPGEVVPTFNYIRVKGSGGHDSRPEAGRGRSARGPVLGRRSLAAAYYPNCAAAQAAGASPLYSGQAGYSTSLDRDQDGVACE